jgi:hypothetical protein
VVGVVVVVGGVDGVVVTVGAVVSVQLEPTVDWVG